MTDRVGQSLVDGGWITREQLEKARRTRDFFGGPLDAHLLKLDFLDENTLGKCLSRMSGLPYAGPVQLRGVPAEVSARIPQELVEQFRLCPFETDGKTIKVAMTDPKDAVAVAKVEAATHLRVEPWVTSDYRLNLALERHYRVRTEQQKAVPLGPQSRSERELSRAEVEETDPASEPDENGGATQLGLDGLPLDAEISVDEHDLFAGRAFLDDAADTRTHGGPVGGSSLKASPLDQVSDALSQASGRDEIAEVLVRFCESRCARAGLFSLSRDGFRCLAGIGRAFSSDRVKKTVIPRESGHLFDQVAEENQDFYLGAVPPLPANRDLFSLLGGHLPPMAILLPIRIKTRVVALLYLDNDTLPITAPDIPVMRRLAAKGGLAFEILLLRNKLKEV